MKETTKKARKKVPTVRNRHGTRVLRSIVCAECGQEDHVHFAPRNKGRTLCRSCAAAVLGIEDPDSNLTPERSVRCTACGRFEATRRSADLDADFMCRDCLAGILSKQANRARGAERLSRKVIRVRRPEDEVDST